MRRVESAETSTRPTASSDAFNASDGSSRRTPFLFFVEGARDKGLLKTWAKKISRPLARWIGSETMILGGAQPARAVAQLREERVTQPDAQGLCLLDRDCAEDDALPEDSPSGLEFFVWPRRHIESYLLVPDAVCRAVKRSPGDSRVLRAFDRLVPEASDGPALRAFDAKALFAPQSPLVEALSEPVSPTHVARAMRADEFHADVLALLDRVARGAGLVTEVVRVVSGKRIRR